MSTYPKWCVASSAFPFGIKIHAAYEFKFLAQIYSFLHPNTVVMETWDAIRRDEDIIQWAAEYYGFDPDKVERHYQ